MLPPSLLEKKIEISCIFDLLNTCFAGSLCHCESVFCVFLVCLFLKQPSQDPEDSSRSSAQRKLNRQFYRFVIFPGKWIKVWYDRLALLALLDR